MEIVLILIGFVLAIIVMLVYEFRPIRKINKIHFYVTRDKNGELCLWINKPYRGLETWVNIDNSYILAINDNLKLFNLNVEDYNNLTFEDDPLEVYLKYEKR